jgi:glutamate racemase
VTGGAIGIFDSGVGGLTVFRALECALPGRSLIYLGDTARVPYGTRSAETVVRYSLEAARFMQRQGVRMLVVACNTASSVAIEPVVREFGLPVLGVILPGADRAVELTRARRIGVIGTRATVRSGAYERAIRSRLPEAEVISRACPLFVPLAEEGWTENEVALQVAETYLAPFRAAEVDTLVLGCTHYPLLTDVIAEVMGPGVRLVDSAESVAARVREELAGERDGDPSGDVEHHFFVTDAPEPFQAVAERFLGRPIARLERATIDGDAAAT